MKDPQNASKRNSSKGVTLTSIAIFSAIGAGIAWSQFAEALDWFRVFAAAVGFFIGGVLGILVIILARMRT